jgi:hypothetical protein
MVSSIPKECHIGHYKLQDQILRDAVLPQPFTVTGEWWSTIHFSLPDNRCRH